MAEHEVGRRARILAVPGPDAPTPVPTPGGNTGYNGFSECLCVVMCGVLLFLLFLALAKKCLIRYEHDRKQGCETMTFWDAEGVLWMGRCNFDCRVRSRGVAATASG